MSKLNGNQLRELRNMQNYLQIEPNYCFGIGWTKGQLTARKQLLQLGYLEYVDFASTFKMYRLTQTGKDFKG